MYAVARISRLFGTDGGVLLNLYDTFPAAFDPETEPLFVEVDNLPVPLWCERFEPHGAGGAFAVFADLDTPERMAPFVGRPLMYAETDEGTDDDEFELGDLIGFTVEADGLRGEIVDFYDSDINPLFGIEFGDGGETLVPAVEEFIAGIDFEGRHIRMVLPEGLTDL